jgi:exopolysaccharide production protein ExoQ
MTPSRAAATDRRQQLTAVLARLERLYATGALIVFSGALVPVVQMARGQKLDLSGGDRLMQAIILPIFLVAASIIVLNLGRSLRTAARAPLTLLLVGFAIASTLWSDLPELSLRRSLALAGTTLFGIYLVTRFDSRTRLHLLSCALTITLIGSVLVALLLPEYGTMGGGVHTPWQGIFTDKNTFGRLMVLSAAIFLVKASAGGRLRWLLWMLAGGAAYLVFRAHSATALVVLMSLMCLLPFYLSLRLHYSRLILIAIWAILIGTVGALFVIARSEQILADLGRDATLTGRTELWEAVLGFIRSRVWLGYGYSAFWTGWSGPAGDIWAALSWEPPHAHNGFLDLWLDLGLVGVCICVLDIVLSVRRSVSAAATPQSSADLWGIVFWTVLLLSNISESTLVRQNSLFWVLYVTAVAGGGVVRPPWAGIVRPAHARRQALVGPAPTPATDTGSLSLGVHRRAARRLRDPAADGQ